MTDVSSLPNYRHADRRNRGSRNQRNGRTRKLWLWIPLITILLLLIAVGAVVAVLVPKGLAAKDSLEQAIPLTNQVKQHIVAGDTEAAQRTVSKLVSLTGDARAETDSTVWRGLEWAPVVGPNLHAVRIAAESVDDLVQAIEPLSGLSVEALKPQDGAFDIELLKTIQRSVHDASATLDEVNQSLSTIDREDLIAQVDSGVVKLETALAQANDLLDPIIPVVDVIPTALGGDGPRNYLLMFQNNAESRGTGGNPASIVVLTADNGRLSIEQQASSSDFNNGRPYMVTDVDPETVALYGSKIGRWMQDVTLTPSFPETADIMLAFWDETFGTPIDGVVSFDPVALSYLLTATGPVDLPTGHTLTGENAVPLLLNEVYSIYPDNESQDIFFSAAAGSAFQALTGGGGDTKQLIDAITKSVEEGRLMYAPATEAEAELIAGTRITGKLPTDNTKDTIVGVYVNDVTEGKLNYYMDLVIDAEINQCTTETPEFTVSTQIESTLQPYEVWSLAQYISPGRFFPKGDISTDLVVYGPVGGSFVSAEINGYPISATPLPHLGRPAVKINVLNHPATMHTVTATFTGPEVTEENSYGPLDVWHTPMVRDTVVNLSTPGCES